MFAYPLSALVTLFAVGVTFALGFTVARARMRYKVAPPSFDGPPEFQRINRSHQNTLEFLPLFLPVLWLAAFTLGDIAAAAIGVFWPVGRILYAAGYATEAKRRFPGFILSNTSLGLLWLGVLCAVIWDWLVA